MPTALPMSQPDGAIFSAEVSSSQVTLVCVRLTENKTTKPQNPNLTNTMHIQAKESLELHRSERPRGLLQEVLVPKRSRCWLCPSHQALNSHQDPRNPGGSRGQTTRDNVQRPPPKTFGKTRSGGVRHNAILGWAIAAAPESGTGAQVAFWKAQVKVGAETLRATRWLPLPAHPLPTKHLKVVVA